MKYGSPSFSVFLVDGYNLLGAKVQSVSHETGFELERGDGLGDRWHEQDPTGIWNAALEQTGAFFNTAAANIHAAMKSVANVERLVAWAVAGNTIGSLFTAAKGAYTSKYRVISTNGKLTKADVTYEINGQVDDGVILQDHVTRTVDWTGTTVDSGASSANGGVGYLFVSEMAGLTGAVITIQDSPDGVTWADLLTFTLVAGAPAKQRLEVAGTVDRRLRANGDVTGAGSLKPFVGFARNP